MTTTTYRGFTISVRAEDGWVAEIARQTTGKRFSKQPSVPITEGPEAAERRARNLVDAYLALNEG